MTNCDFEQPGFHATANRVASDLKGGRLEDASDLLRRELQTNPSEISELVSEVRNIQERQHANGDHRVAIDQVIVRPDAAANGESSEVLIRDKRSGYTERIGELTFGVDDVAGRPPAMSEPEQFRTQPVNYPPGESNLYAGDGVPPSNYTAPVPSDYQCFGAPNYNYAAPLNYDCAPPINCDYAPPLYPNNFFNNQMSFDYNQCSLPYAGYPRTWHHRYAPYEPFVSTGCYEPAIYGSYSQYGYPSFGLSLNLGSLFFGRSRRRY